MTQLTAMFVMFVLYGVLPAAGLYLGYRGIKKVTAPKMLEYKAMPQLGYIPEKSLPVEVKTALDQINDKGEKLRVIYGDTNNDGKIDDKDTVNETYIMIQNLMVTLVNGTYHVLKIWKVYFIFLYLMAIYRNGMFLK